MGRFISPRHREVSNDASSAGSGWKLNFYSTGTLVRKDTFSDEDLTTANANPVVADASGRFGDIFLESGDYRVVLTDADDSQIWDADPVDGSIGNAGSVESVTSSTTVTLSDSTKLFAVNASSAVVTITLLAAATAGDGFQITIKKVDSSDNQVTIDANGAETIDGAANVILYAQYETVTVRSDGSEWHVISRANFNPLPKNYMTGLGMQNVGSDSEHDIRFLAGECRDAADSVNLVLSSNLIKQIDADWSAGNNMGGFPSGLTIAADTWYHAFAVDDGNGGTDVGYDTSTTAANLLADTGGTKYRRIGSVLTDSSSNITGFLQEGDTFYWDDPPLDVGDAITGGSTATGLTALTVPIDVKTTAIINLQTSQSASAATGVYVHPDGITTESGSATDAPLSTARINAGGATSSSVTTQAQVLTNTSQQIRIRNINVGDTFWISTVGWIDRRGRDG